MGLNRGWNRFLPTLNGNVMTDGGSLNLAKGQVGFFDVKKPTKNGLKAISDFAGLSKSTRMQLRLGQHELGIRRTQDNKNQESRSFTMDEIESIEVSAPDNKKKVDDLIVGYDGINASTALTFEEGDYDVLEVTLSGEVIGVLGYPNSKTSFTIYFNKDDKNITDQEVVEKAVEAAKNQYLAEMIPVTDLVDISVINSENPNTPANPTAHTYYHLTLPDVGDSNALANVQAQYGSLNIQRTERNGVNSTYTVLTTDGAPDQYEVTVDSVIKGCDDCPSGFSAEDGGFIYYVSLEDGGSDESATVQGLPGAVTSSAEKQGQDNGKGIYVVATDDELTQAEIGSFVTTNKTAVIELVGKTEDICNDSSTTKTSWVEGDSCNASTHTYQLQLPDDDCDGSRIAEVQAAYPDLSVSIAQDETPENIEGGCQTVYETEVTTDIVCEECDPIFRELFESEAPHDFRGYQWKKADKTYDDNALMGIRIKGKETISNPSEYLRDTVPYINSSVHLSVAGGFFTGNSVSFDTGGEPFNVVVKSRAADLQNLGGNLRELEDRDFTYFNGHSKHKTDFSKALLGEESVLKGNAQYVVYSLNVNLQSPRGALTTPRGEKFSYLIAAEVGKHQDIEAVLNKLAGRLGLPSVVAYGN